MPADESGPRAAWWPVAAVALVGAAAAWALSRTPADAQGARRLASPEIVLAAFDALALLLLARPGVRSVPETCALLAVAAPFHAAFAATAGGGPGHLACSLLAAGAWAAAALVAARAPAASAVATSALAFGLPLAAYGLREFARLPVDAAFLASPLTGPVLLAHRATSATAADAVPALLGAGVLAAVGAFARRPPSPTPSPETGA